MMPEKSTHNKNDHQHSQHGNESSEGSSPFTDNVQQLISQGKEAADNVSDKVQEYKDKTMKEARSYLKNNPGQAMLAMLGVGFLAGLLIARR